MRSPSTDEPARAATVRSLAGQMALIGLSALALLLLFDTIIAYRDARETVYAAHDRSLRASLGLLGSVDLAPDALLPRLAESLGTRPDEIYFAEVGRDGVTLAGDDDLPFIRPDAATGLRFENAHHRGNPVRIASLLVEPATPAAAKGIAVLVVAENTRQRVEAVHRLVFQELRRHLLTAVLGVILGWAWLWTVKRSLHDPAEALARREAEDLTPLSTDDVPREVRPLVDAVNAHLARLAGLLEASRRFAADVAHQLRTPLTLLGAQAQYALRQDDPGSLRESIEGIAVASRGAQRLCNQMLTLSRIEAARGAMCDGVRIDLAALLRETALDLSVLAIEKRIDLAYEDDGRAVHIVGNEIMMHELFSNLIDNALRYAPREGKVRITLAAAGDGFAEVDVADSGPGIPAEVRETVFQRFHRRLDRQGGGGSGLGLAIAHQIALVHRGSIAFDDVDGDCGFVVRVRLPVIGDATEAASKGS
jgi:two-component system sensor histidine kinase TctE